MAEGEKMLLQARKKNRGLKQEADQKTRSQTKKKIREEKNRRPNSTKPEIEEELI